MKFNRKIILCALFALMILCSVNACSAENSFNETLGDGNAIIADESNDLLSASGDTYIVDGNGGGDYATISEAVSASTGGETIYIKNGEYTESAKISITKSLSFVGESKDGVIIKSTATNGVFETTENGVALSFANLKFKDISAGSIGTLNIGGDSDLDVINCTFDNCKSKYGAMWIKTTGNVNIENSKILNSKETATKGATAIYLQGAGNYNIKNTIIDNAQHNSTGFSYGVIYVANNAATATLDNVVITNCGGNAYAIIYSNGKTTVKNSRIVNNTVPGATGNAILRTGKELFVEQTVIVNNTSIGYLIYNNRGNTTLNYNYIADNALESTIYGEGSTGNSINADYNYWGSDDKPSGVPVNNWVVGSEGNYRLNNGDELEKDIPSLIPPADVSDAIFVSFDGDDSNSGSEDAPVATIKKAVELAQAGKGKIAIKEGTIVENNIELPSDKAITVIGVGNAIIDGNSSSESIFVMHGGNATFINLKFRNTKPKYGGAIFINYGTGTSREVIDINVAVENCEFDNTDATSRGGAIYAWYTEGSLSVINSNFTNIDSGSWGAVCVGYSSQYGLDVEIKDCNFRNNTANNGASLYLQASKIDISGCTFINNTAIADSAAVYLYNTTATIDNCVIVNNTGGSKGTAVKVSMPSTAPLTTLTITNSIIENNNGKDSTLPALYADLTTLNVSYSSLINDLSVETRTGTGYGYIYGQGIANVNNNWWATKDPRSKVEGTNITLDNWVIINAVANASEVIEGDEVKISVDFNHVNTTAGEIEELSGGVIPKEFDVQLTAENGSIDPESLIIAGGEVKDAIFTGSTGSSVVNVICDGVTESIEFNVEPDETYYGIIHADSINGNDANDGSEASPVATIHKAMELAFLEGGSGQIILHEGTYKGIEYRITKNLTITGEGRVVVDGEGRGRIFTMKYGDTAGKLELSNMIITGANHDYGEAIYSFADNLIVNNITFVNNPGNGTLIKTYGNMTMVNSSVSDFFGGNVIEISEDGLISIINCSFDNIEITSGGYSNYGVIYISFGTGVLTIENSTFTNNKARQSVITIDTYHYDVVVKNSKFINNSNEIAYGGVIRANQKLTIDDSVFINNYAFRQGGAVYVGMHADANITRSVFIDNYVSEDYDGDAIYNSGKLTVSYSVLLTSSQKHLIVNGADSNTVKALYNWWGKNTDPSDLVSSDETEDDWGYPVSNAPIDVSKWVVMDVKTNITGNNLAFGDKLEMTVDFTNYKTSTSAALKPLSDNIPPVDVTSQARLGSLDYNKLTTENGIAKFIYTAGNTAGVDTVTFTTRNQVINVKINIFESIVKSNVSVELADIDAKKYDSVVIEANLISDAEINSGVVELYLDEELIATLPVSHSKVSTEFIVSKEIGTYNLTAKFVDDTGLFTNNQSSAILNVTGVCELTNSTFFKFFDKNGVLRDEIIEDELVFHGDFSGLGVKIITIPRNVMISGDNAKIYNMAFALNADGILFADMTVIANGLIVRENSGALILVNGTSIKLENVLVNYSTPRDILAFGIFATSADEFNLINSTIIYDSNIENGLIVTHHALQIRDSDDFVVRGNVINATYPARDIISTYFHPEREGINQDLLLAAGIQNADNGLFTQNEINVITKSSRGRAPTMDTFRVYNVSNIEISYNNITQIDSVNVGSVDFSNVIDLYNFTGVNISYNNVLINTTAGNENNGTAYVIQATGPYSGLVIDHNNLTSVSNGPASGIFSQNYDCITDITVTNNNIDVSGMATSDVYALVSGMELQDTSAKVYNNTIYAKSKGEYADENALYGISYVQTTDGNHEYDIRDNTVYSEGKYTVYLCNATNSNVTDNALYAHELVGDRSVYVDGDNNVVINNTPGNDIMIEANANSVFVGENATVEVNLSEADARGNVSVNVDGVDYTAEVSGGSATIVLPVLPAGEYTFDVTYSGDDKYGSNATSVSFTVNRYAVEFTKAKGHPGRLDKNATVDVILSQSDATGTVSITVDGVDYSAELVEGKAIIYAPLLPAGVYNFDVVYSGDDKYENNTAPITFNVNKYYPTMKATATSVRVDENASVDVVLPEDASGTVSITVDGVDYTGDVIDGNATIVLPVISEAGEQVFNVAYSGDDKYRPQNTEVTFNVIKNNVEMKATARTVRVGDNVTVNVVLSSDATGNVSIDINGTVYTGTVEDGAASIVIPDLPIGQYALTVEYSGDGTYKAKNTTVTFNVNKQNSALKATARTVHVGDDVVVNVALSGDAAGEVIISVDGTDYAAAVENGTATIVIPDLPYGQYALGVQYSGDDKYKARNTTVTFNVNKASTTMKSTARTVKVGSDVTVNVVLASDAAGEVFIEINGTNYTAIVENGVAEIVLPNLPAGQYALDVKYGGNDKYKAQSTTVTFNVNKYNVRMKATAAYYADGDYSIVSVNLSDDATGKISVDVAGNNYTANVVNGTTLVALPKLPAGDYQLDVEYSGDAKYKAYTAKTTLNVLK